MRLSGLVHQCLIISIVVAASTLQEDTLALHRQIRDQAQTRRANESRTYQDSPTELERRDGTKYVFMHHIVGNTYSYTPETWLDDISRIAAKGVDAIALNIGGDDWQKTQIGYAYAAAQSLGVSTKLFISFDFTTDLGCSLPDIVARTRQFSSHPYQFKVNGKPMVSSYAGDCLGNSGWQSLKDQTGAYVMPFIWGLEGKFGNYPSMDSWYCWGCAWPQGNYAKNTDDDNYYLSQLGSKYATTVSMWFFTHYTYQNRILRSDDWLLNNRWEQLFNMRNQLTFVEMVTWNDFGESDYFGPVRVDQPTGTTWTDGFPHTAWFDMSAYYIQAFKTGVYPQITQDVIYYWARPHPKNAVASNDIGRPENWDWTQDLLWVAAFCTSTCTITLQVGSSSATFANQPAGVNKLKLPLAAGRITVTMTRNGQTVISKTDPDYLYVLNPIKYNFNAYVNAASASGTTATTTSTTTTTTTTSSAPTPTSTTIDGVAWTYLACYTDSVNSRTLGNGISSSTNTNTLSTCLRTCRNAGYVYGGVEYGVECFCSNSIRAAASVAFADDCNYPCSGGTGLCGGSNRINVYNAAEGLGMSTTITSSAASSTPTWSYLGCYTDSVNSRTLNGLSSSSQNGQTVSGCLATCAAAGYPYGGVEYGVECFCGSAISSGSSKVTNTDCNMACSGKSTDICGSGNRLSMYQRTSSPPTVSWNSLGCYTDSINARTLTNGLSFTSSSLTIASCQSSCASAGYPYAGVEYARECYCAAGISSPGTKTANGECNMACAGASSQSCGGGNRIFIYQAASNARRRRVDYGTLD